MPFFLKNELDSIYCTRYKKKENKNNIPVTGLYINNEFHYKNFKIGFLKRMFMNKYEKKIFEVLKIIINNKHEKNEKISEILKQCILSDKYKIDSLFLLAFICKDYTVLKEYLLDIEHFIDKFNIFFNKHHISYSTNIKLLKDIDLLISNDLTGLFISLANIIYESLNTEKSLELLLNVNIKTPLLKLYISELYIDKGNYSDAINILQTIKTEDKIEKAFCYLIMGISFRKEGLLKSSIGILRNLRRSRNLPLCLLLEAKYQLGLTFEQAKNFSLAKREYTKILQVNYNYKDVCEKIKNISSI